MPVRPLFRFRPLSSLLLSLALGCSGAQDPESSTSKAEHLVTPDTAPLPPGLRPSLVKDLQVGIDTKGFPSGRSSVDQSPAPVSTRSAAYFAAMEESTGVEFWRTDGTLEGTRLVRDLTPGADNSIIQELATLGDTVYLIQRDENGWDRLWKSDGTPAGTVKLSTPTGELWYPANLVPCGDTLFFLGNDLTTGGLWRSDGTPEGTTPLPTGPMSFDWDPRRPASIVCANGTLFFLGQVPTGESELWKSDGTPGGTVRLGSVGFVMPTLDERARLVAAGSRVFLNTADFLTPLWTSDGTPEGTVSFGNTGPAAGMFMVSALSALGETLYFAAVDASYRFGVWRSDGTDAGTWMLAEHAPLCVWNIVLVPVEDTLLVSCDDLYRTDGTPEGTVPLGKLFFPDAYLHTPLSQRAIPLNERWLLIAMAEGSDEHTLWVSDGTQAGTTPLLSAQGRSVTGVRGLTRLGNRVLFWAGDDVHGQEPWVTDGTPAGTHMLYDIYRGDSSAPELLTDVAGTLFFTAYDSEHGRELWRTDGTPEGTVLLTGSGPEGHNAEFRRLTAVGSTLFFIETTSSGHALWKSDGTPAGTVLVRQLGRRTWSYDPELAAVGTTLFFTNYDAEHGIEPWKSDGTPEGTVLLADINPGPGNAQPMKLTRAGELLFFTAAEGVHGRELWRTDGTPEGTVLLADLYAGKSDGMDGHDGRALLAVGGTLFFTTTNNGTHRGALWKSDGTPEGTVLVKDLRPAGNSLMDDFVQLGGELFFTANDGLHGREVWKSDGTPEGTVLVKDLVPGSDGAFPEPNIYASLPRRLYAIGDTLYLVADDGEHGTEPWKSDGTAEGTVLLRDVMPGPLGSGVGLTPLVPVGPHAHTFAFSATDGMGGVELWMSDGTATGTRRLVDLSEGPMSAAPSHLTVSGSRLFFVADEGVHGRELWSVKQAAFTTHP